MAEAPPPYNPDLPPPEQQQHQVANHPGPVTPVVPAGYVAQQQPIPDIQYAPHPSSRPYQGYPAPTYPIVSAPPPVVQAAPQAPPIINVVQTQQSSQATAVAT